MRQLYAYRITCLIALIILGAAIFFAWIRSNDIVLLSRRQQNAGLAAAPGWPLGARMYADACRQCHASLPNLGRLVSLPSGRAYLVVLLLYGADGTIQVQERSRRFVHPPFEQSTDDELAATLNYMLANWGNQTTRPPGWQPYTPQEIRTTRTPRLQPTQVLARRPPMTGPKAGLE